MQEEKRWVEERIKEKWERENDEREINHGCDKTERKVKGNTKYDTERYERKKRIGNYEKI